MSLSKLKSLLIMVVLALSGTASAQNSKEAEKDPVPKPPRITPGDSPGLKEQAGIGGKIAYSSAGVLEMGGFLGVASAKDYTEISATPSVGDFFADNLQISGLATMSYSKLEVDQGRDVESTVGTLILEPSFHVPTTDSTFVFIGLGAGGLFEVGEKPGLAIAPRVGYKNLVGRSGMLTFALQGLYGLNESEVQTAKGTVLTVKSAYNFDIGYTVLL